ncbi:bifunctional 5,10-methylene-tetrahydrofolate dehydrogenase/5,10-methylene-tetrahydrofolate cyclohydrolase [Reichenbachiella sp. 5M10]|uniref:bifunctional 5,10-methylenetetrahydrofolate dehydrogenase/5,10-methenyltetrahydrofolate cyclohydrolase n=1 Tax=Reichenbachiella sp. 5M10 TaxID=1889772 RepID=UPI000C147D30|nr:bifunctional 5,10-methylenetetrahydrofolate dehydrogenase/5,10-methenyltetrahydrofolate cyclohydrolase [Reichenbachiella sp. 5M10]PIB34301.1 bifunctional 5,10-methylene-tetrahydrofolate dehydrogenase/5,10-methylene-tetrahydrofolate cyclohydrolase [Reichenbachiella sp. 5M10]
MPTIIDGKKVSADIKDEIKLQVEAMKNEGKRAPHLAIIIVGDDGASHTYVGGKITACKAVGFDYTLMQFAGTISEDKLLKHVDQLNADEDIDGFIVQLPLPEHISVEKVTASISPEKDVDGFTNENFGSITSKAPLLMPATPLGIMELIKRYEIETQGKNCVIIGASRLVGAPLALMMSNDANATVTLCHKYTEDLAAHTRQADILVVAVGKPGLVSKDMVKEDAVIIDVGTTRVEDKTKKSGFKLSGDVEYAEVAPIASYITPVPGGVGPMTIASLLINTLQAAKNNLK